MNQDSDFVAICWLHVTDYMRGWMRSTLGGTLIVRNEPVLSVRHLDGMDRAFRMEADDTIPTDRTPGNAISATWYNALAAGISIDPLVMERMYGVTRELLRQYVPILCPVMAISSDGILTPWTGDIYFGKQQAVAIQRLLREAFWRAVAIFSIGYANEHPGGDYPQVEMVESFCRQTGTDDLYVEPIRREWQRRQRRERESLGLGNVDAANTSCSSRL